MKSSIKKLSSWSMALSFLCAIHCMAMPILVAGVSLAGLSFFVDPFWEMVIIIASSLLAASALISSYKKHQNIKPLLIFVLGMLIILPGMVSHIHLLIASGSIFSAIALLFNWQIAKKQARCC